MKNRWYQSLIKMQGAAGPVLSASVAQTSLLSGQAKFTMPAGFLESVNDKLWIRAYGKISTAASSPGTFAFFVNFGVINVFAGGASVTLATSATNLTWKLDIELDVLSVGSGTAATVLGCGELKSFALSAATPVQLLPASAPAAGTGFDSTTSFQVDLQGQWSVNSASNAITCFGYGLISPN